MRKLAQAGPQRRIVGYTEDALVSSDVIGDTHSCLVDSGACQQLSGDTVKLVAWYDHVTGYCHRTAELLAFLEEQL